LEGHKLSKHQKQTELHKLIFRCCS